MRYVAIKGMDKPTKVEHCPLNNFGMCDVPSEPPYECWKDVWPNNSPPDWCPLVIVDGEEVKEDNT